MADYGIKISKEKYDVKNKRTEENSKNFQLVSSKDCWVKLRDDTEPSEIYMFWGYVEYDGMAHSANFELGDNKYIIFANRVDE